MPRSEIVPCPNSSPLSLSISHMSDAAAIVAPVVEAVAVAVPVPVEVVAPELKRKAEDEPSEEAAPVEADAPAAAEEAAEESKVRPHTLTRAVLTAPRVEARVQGQEGAQARA